MNPTILLPAMSKILGDTGPFSLSIATGLEGKLWVQTFQTLLKIDLVSYRARAEELVNT